MTSKATTRNQAIHLIVEEVDGINTTMVDRPSRLRKRRVRFQQREQEEVETEAHEQQQKDNMTVDGPSNDNDIDNTGTTGVDKNALVLTDEMCRELWYQQDEIDRMKADVKQCVLQKIASQKCRRSRATNNNSSAQPEKESCTQEKEDKDRFLGLYRYSPQRSQWKRSAIYYTLLAQKQQKHLQRYSSSPSSSSKSKSKRTCPSLSSSLRSSSLSEPYKQQQVEDFVRKVSLRCTAWAREMAVKQGFKDYCAVHDPLASLFDDRVDHKGGKKDGDDDAAAANKRRKSVNYNDCFFSDHAVEDDEDNIAGNGDVSNIDDVEDDIIGYSSDHNENGTNADKNNSINCCRLRDDGGNNNKRKRHSSTTVATMNSDSVLSTPASIMEGSNGGGRNVRRRVSTKAEDETAMMPGN